MGILENLAVLALGFALGIALWTHREGRMALSFLVGVSAGLVAAQVFRVHIFTIVVLVWVLFPGGQFNKQAPRRIALMGIAVGLLALTTLLGDLVNSETLALQLIGLAVSAALVVAFSTKDDRRYMLGGLLAVITLSSIVGLLQVVKIVPIETWHRSVSAVGRPLGIYPEPDWLGMFAGAGAVMAWRAPMASKLRTLAVAVNIAAFVLAFARAAWIAVAVTVAVAVILSWADKRRKETRTATRGRGPALLVLGAAALVVVLFIPVLVADLTTRLERTLQVQDDDISGQARVRQFDSLLRLADTAPFYGHGLSASGRVGVWGQIVTGVNTENNVASNWLLAMWVDGKFLAVPLVLFLIGVMALSVRTIQGQALLVVLLSSLFSNATFFPVTWLLLALCLADLPIKQPKTDQASPQQIPKSNQESTSCQADQVTLPGPLGHASAADHYISANTNPGFSIASATNRRKPPGVAP